MKAKRPRRKLRERPFADETLRRARDVAERYQLVLWFEQGEWYGRGLELPGVMEDGKTSEQCVRKLREALVNAVAFLMERGDPVPSPASSAEGPRTEQVNLRLTTAERVYIEAAAREAGFTSTSEFVRAAAVRRALTKP